MALQGRTLKTRLAIVLGLSMTGALFAIWGGVNQTTKQDQFETAQTTTIASNDANRSVASENLDSLLDEEARPRNRHLFKGPNQPSLYCRTSRQGSRIYGDHGPWIRRKIAA